jgi:preprotein translocase subunit SecA
MVVVILTDYQAIEAKENVKSKPQRKPLQQLRYRIFQNVQQTGMTGTAVTEAGRVMANIY